jgi:hypothetical protein
MIMDDSCSAHPTIDASISAHYALSRYVVMVCRFCRRTGCVQRVGVLTKALNFVIREIPVKHQGHDPMTTCCAALWL